MSTETKVVGGVIAGIVVLTGIVIWATNRPQAPINLATIVHADDAMTGTINAKVTVVEFGDYQCPACGYEYPILKQLVDTYKKNPNFNFVFKNFPLPQHQNAPAAAEAAEAAGEQGKYWEMHDALYEHQKDWVDVASPLSLFTGYAQTLGLDVPKFQTAIQGEKFKNKINKDVQDGQLIAINATPTIFVNGEKLVGTASFDQLKQKVDTLLNK